MTMTDNLTHAWRATPLDHIMPYSRLLDNLELAGYETAGDVLDAEPWDLVDDVYGVGPKRAIAIRQKVFDYVKAYETYLDTLPEWTRVDYAPAQPAARRSPVADLVSALCVVTAVGLIAYLLAWVVL